MRRVCAEGESRNHEGQVRPRGVAAQRPVLGAGRSGPRTSAGSSASSPSTTPLLQPASVTVPPEAPVVVDNAAADEQPRLDRRRTRAGTTEDLTDDVLAAYTLAVAVSPPAATSPRRCSPRSGRWSPATSPATRSTRPPRRTRDPRTGPRRQEVPRRRRHRRRHLGRQQEVGPRARPDADHPRELAGRRSRHGRRRRPRPAEHLRRGRRRDGLPLRRRPRPLHGRRPEGRDPVLQQLRTPT